MNNYPYTNKIFDSHAHYDDDSFDIDRSGVLSLLPQNGVELVINAASNLDSAQKGIAYAKEFAHIYAAVGIHPHDAAKAPVDYLHTLRTMAAESKVCAIGEIGLDYHYDFSPREVQRAVFEAQLLLANELDLPVIIHDREAHGDMYELLKKMRPKSGVLHCFSGGVELLKETLSLGLYIGLGGAVTFKNAKKPIEVAAAVPLERLLLETDAPYMSPVPFRGKRCESPMIALVAQKISEIKGVSVEEVIGVTNQNARQLFKIS
ncbi:MAG: TatD family hydrolase [Oscillospiraceae bacterium]|jgi:TatD DNase family protein|nr:TatD family hydrolase [Oscillospiraceae bacterium]